MSWIARNKISDEEIVAAYRETGSVWRAAKRLGTLGQGVHERLRAIGYPLGGRHWTREEYDELRSLVPVCALGEIARRLGRTYAGVAAKISRLGLAGQVPLNRPRKIPRGAGFDKVTTQKRMAELEAFKGPVTRFCRGHGLDVDLFVRAVQQHAPDRWLEYTRTHYDLGSATCAYCQGTYYPTSKKQQACSRKCQADHRRDKDYFGGKRRNTIGLAEGVCQLCRRAGLKGLSSHHILGKENDQENEYLIALCSGCHDIVGRLARRTFTADAGGWEDLIHLVMLRRMAEKGEGLRGTSVCVEVEYLTAKDCAEEFGDEDTALSFT